ncbi:3-hydroxyacyl-CoA dehydrogenase family protein [Levilactobacillus acidifarinae]|uniref:L-gulonate 3-dehydrogenase n=1 Tax=Levilactobacillus acidifarinae DSM 19394 = JCM 15949 TaxID=1423715 RepID=A0A0R1LR16_9LACO|nr:3-hydroxyacyl-CoA dehydrogenase family protein [Levilactobacillus acidifarinae]KRK96067.1 3-hydroxybutyryl-CoA dehydrogenase [Levilactobacillus acidifarinae DSM 19394]GEO69659.1 butyryl-CoA dehydrogenase [Levilactobacillus acidifarinae]
MSLSSIHTIANLGAGTMGHATALQFALHGYPVYLLDTDSTALQRGMAAIQHDLTTFQETDLLTEDPAVILARIQPTTDNATALTSADFVIESVVEDLTVKQQVWQTVEQFVGPEVLCATNTSGLSPTAIQETLTHPERFVVAHFWNPAQLMPLVEVVPGEHTSKATVDTTVALMNHIGKHAVPLQKESLGFVGNRIQLAVLREALHIIDDGIATPEAVDDIIKYSLGRRWSLVGPVASADLGGLDIFKNISAYLYADLANDTGTDPALTKKVAANQLGLKTGQGFYNWTGDAGKQVVAQRDRDLLNLLKTDQEHH